MKKIILCLYFLFLDLIKMYVLLCISHVLLDILTSEVIWKSDTHWHRWKCKLKIFLWEKICLILINGCIYYFKGENWYSNNCFDLKGVKTSLTSLFQLCRTLDYYLKAWSNKIFSLPIKFISVNLINSKFKWKWKIKFWLFFRTIIEFEICPKNH